MNAVFYYHFLGLGGVEASLLNRLEALRASGLQAEFWYSRHYGSGARYLSTHRHIRRVDPDSPEFFASLDSVDVLVVIDYPQLVRALRKRSVNTPVIYESHASYPPALERYYAVLDSGNVRAVVVPSEYNRQLIRNSGRSGPNPLVIPNCVDATRFADATPGPAQRLLARLKRPTVLWIGRMEDAKNPQDLVRIARALSDRGLRFLAVGDSPDYDDYLSSLAAQTGGTLPRSIHFRKRVRFEDMPALYARTAAGGGLLLSTSHFESSPMTFLEAMAARCPVVSSNAAGAAPMLQGGSLGWLYEAGDVDAAARIVAQLAAPRIDTDHSAILDRAEAWVRSNHAPGAVASAYRSLLAQVAGGG